MSLLHRKPSYTLAEVHTFVGDLDRLTLLRDKAITNEEAEDYNRMLASAKKVLEYVLLKLEVAE